MQSISHDPHSSNANVCLPTSLIAFQHAIHQITERAPEILPTCKTMLVNEEHIVLETCIQMRFESKLDYNRIVMTVDVCVDPVKTFEELSDQGGEGLGERDACHSIRSRVQIAKSQRTHQSYLGTWIRCRYCSAPMP